MEALLAASCPFWPCGLIITVVASVVAYVIGKKTSGTAPH